MFGRTPKVEAVKLDEIVNKILDEMIEYGPDSPEFKRSLKQLERLTSLKDSKERKKISLDNVILVAGNLLGILVIVAYEQKHVMTSKGLGFVRKP